ncbi:histidine kinase [Curvibacter sp. HBC28]|uniref:Histidine kinase n=1 Tax=Curvibacter microcysteis TaxID=3026419 RepID=A0ABT5MJV5_9BURK|nr:histidine kinase [Curvibacter sp. HBC28]MDD0816849.1 histidine kinase [Curvibacter sp. HBC28]
MKFEPLHLLRHYVLVLAASLVISALHYFFAPQKPYVVSLVYSLCIGSCNWAVIDLGRFVVGVDPRTQWPRGWRGPALVAGGIVLGYLTGTALADAWFGWSSWEGQSAQQLRASLLVTLVAGVVISGYFYLQGKGQVLQKNMEEAQHQATEAQLRLLLTQLEPHMLFNTLANLRALVGIDPDRAQQMLDHLIAYLRATLNASRATEHSLQAEFDRLRDYLELMVVRMGPRLSYQLDLPHDLAQAAIPPLLLQALVENSIRHGLEPKVEGGHIRISALAVPGDAAQSPQLQITVQDSGVGLTSAPLPAPQERGRGFGLTQVRERLLTLYGPEALLNLAPAQPGPGTSVQLRFRLHTVTPTDHPTEPPAAHV